MLLAPRSDGERKDDAGPSPAQLLVREIECICLAERVSHALRRTGYSALNAIEVPIRGGAVFLEGRVASYHLKQLAQETARQVSGDTVITNELEVAPLIGNLTGTGDGRERVQALRAIRNPDPKPRGDSTHARSSTDPERTQGPHREE